MATFLTICYNHTAHYNQRPTLINSDKEIKEVVMEILDRLKYDENGLIPAIIQDAENGQVLMVGYMNRQAVERTIKEKMVCFWSRSRQKFWVKGETSGHFQLVQDIYVDCDQDALLIKVTQIGATCHEGYRSCFYRKINALNNLEVIAERLVDPKEVYGK